MNRMPATAGTLALAMLAAGCVSSEGPGGGSGPEIAPPLPVADGSTPECNAAAAEQVIGSLANLDTIDRARELAGTETVRVIGPGQPVTQDFRPDRLNLETDASNTVVTVRCG